MLIYHDMSFLGYNSPLLLFSSVCLDMRMTVSNIACGSFTLKHRLQVGRWNLNGLMSKQFGSKLELDEVLKTIERCHIFGITETHLVPSNGKELAGYKGLSFLSKIREKKEL